MNLNEISNLVTAVTVFIGFLGLLWRGARWASRFIDATEANTASLDGLKDKLDRVGEATEANTQNLTVTIEKVAALDGRLAQIERNTHPNPAGGIL